MPPINPQFEIFKLFLLTEKNINNRIFARTDKIEKEQEILQLINKVLSLINATSTLSQDATSTSSQLDETIALLKKRNIDLPNPSEKESFQQSAMHHNELTRSSIQIEINSLNPEMSDKAAIIHIMTASFKYDGGIKKMIDNQISR